MENVTDYAAEWLPSIVFCLGVYAIVWVIRRLVEGHWPNFKYHPRWKKGILPSLPPIIGGFSATLAYNYPFPQFVQSFSARLFYGLLLGFLSAWAYKLLKIFIKKKTGIDLGMTVPESRKSPFVKSDPPAPSESAPAKLESNKSNGDDELTPPNQKKA